MIDARELRIGNWIHDTESDEDSRRHGTDYATVAGVINDPIEGDGLYVLIRGDKSLGPGYAKPEEYEPIELTDEWLEKFGFTSKYKSVHCHWWGPIRQFDLAQKADWDDDGKSIPQENIWYFGYAGWVVDVTKVHQLQNLYFALTGKELECK